MQFVDGAILLEMNHRRTSIKTMNADVYCFKNDLSIGKEPSLDKVLDDLVLTIHGDRLAGQFLHVDAVAFAGKAQLDAMMKHPFAAHALAYAGLVEQVHSSLLKYARADATLHILAAAGLDDNRLDSAQMQQMRKHQSGWPCADNGYLGAHFLRDGCSSGYGFALTGPSLSASTCCAQRNALLAAGTPQ